jgi:ParB family chromosome partitioning protein
VKKFTRKVPDETALAMSLIENIQREDLNPMEEAAGVQRLVDEFRMTHDQAADAIGRSRSATTNLLRLLKLVKPVQQMLLQGTLEMGHARALLMLDGARQIEAANRVGARGLSVRETEALVRRLALTGNPPQAGRGDRDLARLEEDVSERLGTTVEIRAGRRSRKNRAAFSGLDTRPAAEKIALTGSLFAVQHIDPRPLKRIYFRPLPEGGDRWTPMLAL